MKSEINYSDGRKKINMVYIVSFFQLFNVIKYMYAYSYRLQYMHNYIKLKNLKNDIYKIYITLNNFSSLFLGNLIKHFEKSLCK